MIEPNIEMKRDGAGYGVAGRFLNLLLFPFRYVFLGSFEL